MNVAALSVLSGVLCAGLTGCIVMPGRTAGQTWGGAYSKRFAPPEKKEEKKEEKKDDKKADKKAEAPKKPVEAGPFDRPGYVTRIVKERLWVFRAGSKDLDEFLAKGENAKSVTVLGAGPQGMTARGPDSETIQGYRLSMPGFETYVKDGRLWVLAAGSKDAAEFAKAGELAKSVTLVGRGPDGMSVRAADAATAEAYLAQMPSAGR